MTRWNINWPDDILKWTDEKLIEQIPLARLGHPADVASCVSFLVSEKASYITGQVINVNGGMLM